MFFLSQQMCNLDLSFLCSLSEEYSVFSHECRCSVAVASPWVVGMGRKLAPKGETAGCERVLLR